MLVQKFTSFPWDTLIDWYKKSGRNHLPWRDYSQREDILLYRVWISEILLQQTQVDRVIPYFEKILEKYPSIHDLRKASYEEFFPYYQWMGYYSRARNILKTANIVSTEYGGIFPREKKSLMKLPGVWWYTSSAILWFGYGECHLAWDTNLEKVFARYYNGRKDAKLEENEKEEIEFSLRKYMEQKEDKKETIRAINNALMDFASMIDLKNPENIDWENYIFKESFFYKTRGELEPKEQKKTTTFPIPDATIIVTLHENHRVYYSPPKSEQYSPFILPPSLSRDTRTYIQEYFRKHYTLELSVRPVHKKWLSEDGKPYIAVNAQVQVGDVEEFTKWRKEEIKIF
jgi:A/G-specific adenine glycosylase